MTCTTHHNACDCREAALQERIASLQAKNTHWCSVANQRALDLAAERERVRVLEEALAPFVDIGPQVGAHGVISKKLGGLAPMTVTVTKVQMQRALNAYNARKPQEGPMTPGERDFLTKFTILLGLVLLFALARGMGWIGE